MLLLLLIGSKIVQAQVPGWTWAVRSMDTSKGEGLGICSDATGNTYVTGYFSGKFHIGDSTFYSRGYSDIFVAKFDSSGHLVWAKQAGGGRQSKGKAIALDGAGNIYITGHFMDTTYFDTTQVVSNDTSTAITPGDVFVAKYNTNGKLIWVVQGGGKYDDEGWAITVDKIRGCLYVTGFFADGGRQYSTATFENIILTSPRDYGTFLTKYDTAGNVLWAKSAGGKRGSRGSGVNVDNHGNVFMVGNLAYPSGYFGTIQLFTVNNSADGVFIAKYDSSGNALWARAAGGEFVMYGISCATDSIGNVYITGESCNENTHFGSVTLHNVNVMPAASFHAYLAKYDTSGTVQWANDVTRDNIDYSSGNGIIVDKAGNSYTTGYYSYYCSVKPGDSVWSYSSAYDVLVTKYDANGNGIWATHGGPGEGNGIAIDGIGNLYVTGFVGDAARFGANTLPAATHEDMLLARLSLSTPPYVGIPQIHETASGITVYPNPSSGSINIKSSKSGFTGIRLTDPLGRIVYQQDYVMAIQSAAVHLPNLAAGVYYLTVLGKEGVYGEKIVVAP